MKHAMRRLLVVAAVTAVPASFAVPSATAGPGGGGGNSLPKISFSSSSYSRAENGSDAVITLKRASKGVVSTVRFSTGDGTATAGADYTGQDITVTFDKSQMTQVVHVPILQDTMFEGPETVNLFLGPAVTNAQLANPKVALLTITDDETGSVSVSDAGPTVEGTDLVFTVTMSKAAVVPMSVAWTASDGTAHAPGDFPSGQHGAVAFAPGITSATFNVSTTADGMDEPQETLNVTLSSPSAGLTIGDGTGVGTIDDGDGPPTAAVSSNPTAAEGSSLGFDVTLSAASGFTVTVTIGTDSGSAGRFTPGSTTLTFLPGETTHTFSVSTIDSPFPEPDGAVWAHITGLTNAVTKPFACNLSYPDWNCTYFGLDDAWGYGIITDTDNSGFESGTLDSWSTYVDGSSPTPSVTTDQAHSGTQSVLLGSVGPGEPTGNSAVYRDVTVPATGTTTLKFWVYELGDGFGIDGMFAQVKQSTSPYTVLAPIFDDGSDGGINGVWTEKTFDLSTWAGQTVQLIWVAYEDGAGAPTAYYLDDVTITNS